MNLLQSSSMLKWRVIAPNKRIKGDALTRAPYAQR